MKQGPVDLRISSLLYHLKTIYLFTRSDLKTVVLPQAFFATSSLLTNGFRNIDDLPSFPAYNLLQRLLHAMIWVYASLLLSNLANQRLPGSLTEDAFNKPWRPISSGRISPNQARHAMLYLVPSVMLLGAVSDAFRETTSFIAFLWMYNDLEGANMSIWWRNLLNGLGLMTLSAGATAVTNGRVDYSLASGTAFHWLVITGLVVCTTIHAQDLPDIVGDRATGRETIPIIYGDTVARVSLVISVMFWSFAVPAFWGFGWAGYMPTVGLGLAMNFFSFWRQNLQGDEVAWKLWCCWYAIIYLLPCSRVIFGVIY
ncbi:Putative UbiA prenyltransferase family [Colletotrichum destructivum]|uniref:UbiA prenyltransferase family n=1 Tax=Colletotrichum destructivum TaxID=34406 RepID=A0AAX4J408_9PEZI|nr:Putative UbiA prenyltransferase family [Colletotrichum destructivum]